MGNAQNETQQNDATQNETPQSNATSNNGNSNPKRSWIRRHPILSIILFIILFIIIISIATSKDGSKDDIDDIINKCESGILDVEINRYCYIPCSGGNMTAYYYGCFKHDNLKACNHICKSDDKQKSIITQYNETAKNKIDIEKACKIAELVMELESELEKERQAEEKKRQFENSPRGICESTCNEMYTKNSETWQFCMMGCKDMRSY